VPKSTTTPLPPKNPVAPKTTTTTTKVETKQENKGSFWSNLFGKKTNSSTTKSGNSSVKSGELYNGHPVYIGPKGGKYYNNKNGNKTYIQ
jgi:colicin import membrane protein